jgi:hypothetical protein
MKVKKSQLLTLIISVKNIKMYFEKQKDTFLKWMFRHGV